MQQQDAVCSGKKKEDPYNICAKMKVTENLSLLTHLCVSRAYNRVFVEEAQLSIH